MGMIINLTINDVFIIGISYCLIQIFLIKFVIEPGLKWITTSPGLEELEEQWELYGVGIV